MSILVEILHDQERDNFSADVARQGLDIIQSAIGGIAITRDSRKIRISQPDAPFVSPDKIRWPALPANISVVLTDRPLIVDDDSSASDALPPLPIDG